MNYEDLEGVEDIDAEEMVQVVGGVCFMNRGGQEVQANIDQALQGLLHAAANGAITECGY